MTSTRQWSLGAKLALLGTPFLLLVLLSTIATLWISWQLDGGAAAVNEAGRMRMEVYRISLSVSLGERREVLLAEGSEDVVFEPLSERPYLLYYRDLDCGAVAAYYGKSSVSVSGLSSGAGEAGPCGGAA